jgi:hypothetical protein
VIIGSKDSTQPASLVAGMSFAEMDVKIVEYLIVQHSVVSVQVQENVLHAYLGLNYNQISLANK